jgi:flavodoxin
MEVKMKVKIIYATKTGHSRKIAEAIAKELNADAYNVKNTPIIEGADMLFVVGGIYGGKSAPEMLDYIKTVTAKQTKSAALITSSAGSKGSQAEIKNILKANGVEVVTEEFSCRGGFLLIKMGHPNADDIKGAVEFAKKCAPVS